FTVCSRARDRALGNMSYLRQESCPPPAPHTRSEVLPDVPEPIGTAVDRLRHRHRLIVREGGDVVEHSPAPAQTHLVVAFDERNALGLLAPQPHIALGRQL